MATCGQCGACCEVIPWRGTKKELRAMESVNGTVAERDFLLRHWHRMSRAEARRRNPAMSQNRGHHYYSCDAYDAERHLCTVHDTGEQPYICRGFPYYDDWEKDILWAIQERPD